MDMNQKYIPRIRMLAKTYKENDLYIRYKQNKLWQEKRITKARRRV